MPAYVHRPVVVLPEHRISNDDILNDMRNRHPDHPRSGLWERVVANSGVQQRYWMRPLREAAAASSVGVRAAQAFGDALELGERATREALETTGTDPQTVDCIITSHVTSWTVPSLDVHLVGRLGLRPDVARIPMATLACAGGVQGLIRAHDYVAAHPGATVLLVVAETLSTIYHQDETSTEHVIYKALFGDGAGAAVIAGEPHGPGVAVDDTWEYVLPDSLDRYWGRIDEAGLHFDSTRKAPRAAADVRPYLSEWAARQPVDWAAIHPGGPAIIADTAAGLGLDPEKTGRPALASLAENGNLGGVGILDVLRRVHDDPPLAGSPGVAVAYGPGFVAAAVRGVWC